MDAAPAVAPAAPTQAQPSTTQAPKAAPAPTKNGAPPGKAAVGGVPTAKDAGASGEGAAGAVGAATPEPRKLKLNVRGQESELEEARVIALAQRGLDADARYFEVTKKEQRVAEFEQLVKTDPLAAAEKLGLTPEQVIKFAETRLLDAIKAKEMSPEQRRIAELEAKIAARETEDRSRQQAAHKTEADRVHEAQREQYAQSFISAMKAVGVAVDKEHPLGGWATSQMAMLEAANVEGNFGAPPEVLANVFQDNLVAGASLLLPETLTGDALLDRLEKISPGLVRRVNQSTVERHERGKPGFQRQQPRAPDGRFDDAKLPEQMSREDWRKQFGSIK